MYYKSINSLNQWIYNILESLQTLNVSMSQFSSSHKYLFNEMISKYSDNMLKEIRHSL